MITAEDIEKVNQIKKFIDQHISSDGINVNWELVSWNETLDRLVSNLKNARGFFINPHVMSNFYTAECIKCGWWGSSQYLIGGGQIADTGDYGDSYCPICGSNEINQKGETPITTLIS